MALAEAQLDTWSHQGSVGQSAATYAAINRALTDPSAPFASRTFDVFLQGSYANATNIWADSDIDIVVCLTSTYYEDISNLTAEDRQRHDVDWTAATYGYEEFRAEVASWLTQWFGTGVDASGKAVFVPGDQNRRDADVLVCAEYRAYHSYAVRWSTDFWLGICFWPPGGGKIVNYPKQHIANCTGKHQSTGNRFKPVVRVIKNLRNAMVHEGYLEQGIAPSYFLEGMMWNVPNAVFATRYQDTILGAVRWLRKCDKSQLMCANDIHWLLREGHSVCWRERSFDAFLSAIESYWNR